MEFDDFLPTISKKIGSFGSWENEGYIMVYRRGVCVVSKMAHKQKLFAHRDMQCAQRQ